MEVAAAVHRLEEKKAPSADNITAEEIQAAGEAGIDALFEFAKKNIWHEEVFLKIWKKSIIEALRG